MIYQSTIELLKEMRFSGMAAELEKQLNSAEAYREMPFEDRLAMLIDAEWNRRQSNKYLRCIHGARFAIHDATVEGIEYYEDRHLSQTQMLQFAISQIVIISYSKVPAVTENPIGLTLLAKLPVENCYPYGISACQSF